MFLKKKKMKKKRSGTYSQEETYQKFIQAEGNIMAVLIILKANMG